MNKPCLHDENEFPNDEVLKRNLGETKKIWDTFINSIEEEYPQFSTEWRYYKDGKNWLFKITKKKKTICWVSVYHNQFKTTFYFPQRAEELISNSKLAPEYIDGFINGKLYGKIKGIKVDIKESKDLEMTKVLMDLKEKFK